MLKQTFTRQEIREALQKGADEVIGYGEVQQKAFKHGWDSNADRIWNLLELADPEPTE